MSVYFFLTKLERGITTTWHNDETAQEVSEFFVNVAAAKPSALMVAVLNEDESSIVRSLVRCTCAVLPTFGASNEEG